MKSVSKGFLTILIIVFTLKIKKKSHLSVSATIFPVTQPKYKGERDYCHLICYATIG